MSPVSGPIQPIRIWSPPAAAGAEVAAASGAEVGAAAAGAVVGAAAAGALVGAAAAGALVGAAAAAGAEVGAAAGACADCWAQALARNASAVSSDRTAPPRRGCRGTIIDEASRALSALDSALGGAETPSDRGRPGGGGRPHPPCTGSRGRGFLRRGRAGTGLWQSIRKPVQACQAERGAAGRPSARKPTQQQRSGDGVRRGYRVARARGWRSLAAAPAFIPGMRGAST